MPVTTKPRVPKRNKKTAEDVIASDSAEEAKPTVTVDATTASESEAVAPEIESASDSSASVALPMPSKASSKSSSHSLTPSEAEGCAAALCKEHHYVEIPPELRERLQYIQYLIEEEDELMLERMLRVLQAYPYHLVEQENMIRSALAEMNRRVVAHEQHLWSEERAAALAAAQAIKEAVAQAALEAEEKRIREEELNQLAELQAKYKYPNQGRLLPLYLGLVALVLSLIVLFTSSK